MLLNRFYLSLVLIVVILHHDCAQAQLHEDFRAKRMRMTANLDAIKLHKDPGSKTGVYIPSDLNDALKELDAMLPDTTKEAISSADKRDMIVYHHGLGTWLRNNWGLWGGERLAKYFNSRGIQHPDDMSGTIFDAYWSKLHSKSEDVSAKAAYYKTYWDGLRPSVDVSIKLPGTIMDLSMRNPSGKAVFLRNVIPRADVTVLSLCGNSDIDSPKIMTTLGELRSKYKANDVKFIAVLSEEPGGTVTKIAETEGSKPVESVDVLTTTTESEVLRLTAPPSFLQQIRAALKLDVIVIPQTLVIRRNKTIIKRLNGFDKDTNSALITTIDHILLDNCIGKQSIKTRAFPKRR